MTAAPAASATSRRTAGRRSCTAAPAGAACRTCPARCTARRWTASPATRPPQRLTAVAQVRGRPSWRRSRLRLLPRQQVRRRARGLEDPHHRPPASAPQAAYATVPGGADAGSIRPRRSPCWSSACSTTPTTTSAWSSSATACTTSLLHRAAERVAGTLPVGGQGAGRASAGRRHRARHHALADRRDHAGHRAGSDRRPRGGAALRWSRPSRSAAAAGALLVVALLGSSPGCRKPGPEPARPTTSPTAFRPTCACRRELAAHRRRRNGRPAGGAQAAATVAAPDGLRQSGVPRVHGGQPPYPRPRGRPGLRRLPPARRRRPHVPAQAAGQRHLQLLPRRRRHGEPPAQGAGAGAAWPATSPTPPPPSSC